MEKHATIADDQPAPTKAELKKLRKLEKLRAKRAAADELRKKCQRDHLKREQNFAKETEGRVFQDWERMCSDVRLADVVEELLQTKQNLQMVFDRKNLYIDRTLEERDEMEDIYSRNLQRIKRLIDCYLEMHKYFVTNLAKEYVEDREDRLDDFRQEVALKLSQANECVEKMEGALISLEEEMKQGLVDDRVDFIKKNDDCINTHIERRDRLRDRKTVQLEALHGVIQTVAQEYFTKILHPEKEKAFRNLYEVDLVSGRIIESNRAKIRELNGSIKLLNKRIIQVEVAGTRKIITKRLLKRNLENDIDTHKREMKKLEVQHMERMKALAGEVFHVQKHLNRLVERGRQILRLAQTCAKLECVDDRDYFKKRIDQGHVGDAGQAAEFEFFFDKINRVTAINVLLREERDKLARENAELQRQFKQFCQVTGGGPEANLDALKPAVRGVE
ncbi:dynein regulatory complex subunit 2-like [Culex pipiens pallens]|uniref:dynein regulatory complex subunit 2-like n=1 Tax=Culex pipiens pallens TaxID=42434 RepID=UPI001954556D|nr:dynein regulatory complex subunit 2-like [Culex pipiens pallens]